MNLDKNALLGIVLCMIFYVAYTQYLGSKYPEYGKPKDNIERSEGAKNPGAKDGAAPRGDKEATSVQKPSMQQGEGAALTEPEVQQLSPQELTFDTPRAVYVFDQELSALKSIKLKNYHPHKDSDQWLELLDSPLILQGTLIKSRYPGYHKRFVARQSQNGIAFEKHYDKWQITQKFDLLPDSYFIDIAITFKNLDDSSRELDGGLLMQENLLVKSDEGGGFGPAAFIRQQKSFIHAIAGSREAEYVAEFCDATDIRELESFRLSGENLDFIGIDLHYFLLVLNPLEPKINTSLYKTGGGAPSHCRVSLMAYQSFGWVKPQETVSLKFRGYFGPKDVSIIQAHEKKLEKTVDFGWFGAIAYPLLVALQACYKYIPNYGVAIIILTVILKILFYPLTKAAAVSMKRMQRLQPQMTAIREKFKNDPQRQQKEIMAFMSQNKVNPAKGCLPILPQIPVFIAFYNVLSQAIELRHAPFAGWLLDLSAADPYYVTPLILGALMFLQQKLTPNPGMDKNQARIMLMMPIIFTVMMLSMPAGMVLYMMTNTIISIAQQQWLNKKLDKIEVKAG